MELKDDTFTKLLDDDTLERATDYLECLVAKLNFGEELTRDEQIVVYLADGMAHRKRPECMEPEDN
jgi:hypothetical protein